jgi:hypothetical protein
MDAQNQPQCDLAEPFRFYAKILTPHTDSHTVFVVALADTGCKDNWIAAHIISRAGLEDERKHTERGPFYATG